ncbi:lysylphosphatidylglycerol synthase transmembrane domain-containing protein [Desertivirga brevis]|uniref:lysylphosphatidylglycerol synthase transmembrane domain-containing protein n=1 Tax=Desertivirga brevis TaxID=2810310 RepID=UPI001A95BF8A|nr:lysylphosphatidylglycerol synthase transmembrane domain-containing protein [Pedobacter sp. SYSU D00873]
MDKKKLSNAAKILLKIGVTILLIYLISRKIDLVQVKDIFLKSDPLYIFLALVAYCLSQVFSSWRLLDFLRSIGMDISYGYNLRLYLLGLFYNVFLPGGIGGDGFKIYILRKKYQLPTKRIFLALLLDRLSGLWAIGTLCVILIILIPQVKIAVALPIVALMLGTLVYYIVLKKFFPDYSRCFLPAQGKALIVQSFQLLAVICILLSQQFVGKFSPYLFSFLVASVATVIPVTFGGFGLREYVMTHASGVFNMNQSLAVFVTLAFFIISTIAALPGMYFVYRSSEFANPPSEEEAEQFEKDADRSIEQQSPSP